MLGFLEMGDPEVTTGFNTKWGSTDLDDLGCKHGLGPRKPPYVNHDWTATTLPGSRRRCSRCIQQVWYLRLVDLWTTFQLNMIRWNDESTKAKILCAILQLVNMIALIFLVVDGRSIPSDTIKYHHFGFMSIQICLGIGRNDRTRQNGIDEQFCGSMGTAILMLISGVFSSPLVTLSFGRSLNWFCAKEKPRGVQGTRRWPSCEGQWCGRHLALLIWRFPSMGDTPKWMVYKMG